MNIKTQRQDFTFRIIKVGKTAVSIAVCGLLATLSGVAVAEDFSVNPSLPSFTKSVSTDSLNLYYSNNDGNWNRYSDPLTLTLGAGVNLTGQIVTGGIPAAIFTRDVRDGGSVDSLSFALAPTTLNVSGNNSITGVVGLHGNLDSNTGGNYYGSYTADPISLINVNGTAVSFNSAVHANRISINQGGTLEFYGNVDAQNNTTPGNTTIDYKGNDATVTLHDGVTLTGSIVKTSGTTNGSLIFTGAAHITGSVADNVSAMGLVEVQGAGKLIQIDGNLSADRLNYTAQSVVAVGGDLLLNVNTASGAVNSVSMNNTDSTLQVDGNIVGVAGKAAVTTTLAGKGTVTLLGGTQTVTGDLGQSGLALRQFNVGGAYQSGAAVGLDGNDNISSNTTVSGNVFANTVSLNNATSTDSSLTMASGYSITGAVVTEDNQRGTLTMAGGTQSVNGTVGSDSLRLGTVNSSADDANTTFTGNVFAQNVTNTATTTNAGTSTFNGNVTATNINVNKGISNFAQNVSATTTTIGTGTGNFNTSGGNTSSNLAFSGAGTANLHNGISGAVAYAGNNATVNVWDGKTITGAVTTTTNNTGILNYRDSGVIAGQVGSGGQALSQLNINTNGASAAANGVVNAQSSLFVNAIQLQTHTGSDTLQNVGVLTMSNNANITSGTIRTTANDTGILQFNGTSTVTGAVGTSGTALHDIQVGLLNDGSTVTFNNKVNATTLTYTPAKNTTVVLNDATLGSPLVGTVNFNTSNVSTNAAVLKLGDGVQLDTSLTKFANANKASMIFVGDGTVTGNLGSAANTNQENILDISAGADGKTVTFGGDVWVANHTLHVSGTGVVNLQGNLNGPLQYLANGSVNVGDGKVITSGVTTTLDNQGTLNFVGGTTTQAPIGEANYRLSSVGFHAATTDLTNTILPLVTGPVTVNIGHDVFAVNTAIGSDGVGIGATTANITATGKYLGTNLALSNNTTLNTAGAVTTAAQAAVNAETAVSQVDFAHTNNINGTLTNAATVTQSTVGDGVIQTNNATLNFAVGTQAWSAGTGGLVNDATSSKITGDVGSTLLMGTGSTVNVSLLGSLKNGQTATLIAVDGDGSNSTVPGTYRDNSYVIDTQLSRAGNGSLVMTASRDANTYVAKSGTSGDLSNNAAIRLGTLATNGAGYGADMQTVLNKLDIDQWGYGNNQANLATQVKRLAPIANNSMGLSALSLGAMADDSIGLRMHELRNVPQQGAYETASLWLKNSYQRGAQSAVGNDDGYKTKLSGLSMGLDSRPDNRSIVGVAFSYGAGTVNQTQFRTGDQANLKSTQLSMYGAYDFTPELFLDGSVSIAKQNTTGNRATAVGRTALFNFDGTQSAAKVDMGYRIKFKDTTTALTPLVSFEDRSLKQNAYSETNAGDIGLNVGSQRLQSKQAGVGLRLTSTEYMGGMVVKPDVSLMTVRDRGQYGDPVTASFIGDGTSAASFNTGVASSSPRSTKLALGVGLLMSKTSSMMVRYQHVKRDSFTSNMAELVARWDF